MIINIILLILLLCDISFAAAPVRQNSYNANETILSANVTANENVIFSYLQAGVDTYADGSIVNADISSSANIQSDKLNLSSIVQDIAMSSAILNLAKGATVSSASSITLGDDGNFFIISGTTTITSITIKQAGTMVVLQFSDVLTLTDGSNLVLAGDFTTTANDTITLVSDGTNWVECARSVN